MMTPTPRAVLTRYCARAIRDGMTVYLARTESGKTILTDSILMVDATKREPTKLPEPTGKAPIGCYWSETVSGINFELTISRQIAFWESHAEMPAGINLEARNLFTYIGDTLAMVLTTPEGGYVLISHDVLRAIFADPSELERPWGDDVIDLLPDGTVRFRTTRGVVALVSPYGHRPSRFPSATAADAIYDHCIACGRPAETPTEKAEATA